MRKLWILLLITVACGPGLTEEQKRKIKAEMEAGQIKKITEAQITEAALLKGRELQKEAADQKNHYFKNEYGIAQKLSAAPSFASESEKILWDAMIGQQNVGENIQKIGPDSLLFTAPEILKSKSAQDSVNFVWRVSLSKRQLILKL
ncbi:MAG: hypothetical protein O9340_04915 [Cyclobacteriaceae bacterium]|jgi:hypothetical protein|nr:hypothetical protein [Cyclobacteriaceae bacterium]